MQSLSNLQVIRDSIKVHYTCSLFVKTLKFSSVVVNSLSQETCYSKNLLKLIYFSWNSELFNIFYQQRFAAQFTQNTRKSRLKVNCLFACNTKPFSALENTSATTLHALIWKSEKTYQDKQKIYKIFQILKLACEELCFSV